MKALIHHTDLCGCVSGMPQYEATKAYMPKEPDELGLQQAELVIVLQKEEGEAVVVSRSTLTQCLILYCS